MTEPLMSFENLRREFTTKRGQICAVDDVSLDIASGEILCLVGESGSGKTTLARMAAGFLPASAGTIRFEGRDIATMHSHERQAFRRAVQIVHQDPYASLNPVHSIEDILVAPLMHHKLVKGRRQARARAAELLTLVDLTPAENFLSKYPHQLSGGQRQRVSVARALTLNPRMIIADEAVSMLDVSIRVSILNTMLRLRNELGVTFLFITHDLAVVKYFAWEGNVAVMYVGKLVEYGPTPRIIGRPLHPYTRALLAAIPEADPDVARTKSHLQLRSLEIPNLVALPSGCVFHPRCPYYVEGLCDTQKPDLSEIGPDRLVACHVVAREQAASPEPADIPA